MSPRSSTPPDWARCLFDLLTVEEELDRNNVFDIDLLAGRLLDVTTHVRTMPDVPSCIGYFGASTGGPAALYAAADPAASVAAVVSRGGRPDLASPKLAQVRAPTLLIVGGRDHAVIELNRAAQSQLRCPNQLQIVPGATHLFEEPGTLDAVARLASSWFTDHLTPSTPSCASAGTIPGPESSPSATENLEAGCLGAPRQCMETNELVRWRPSRR